MKFDELGNTPISEDSPSGKDVRYEPDFEALSAEISKLSTPSATSAIDWKQVISLSSVILEKQSKHLQAACYLCYALIRTENMDGLLQGVHILKDLLENFWETMYPVKKRMKGRRGIILWWDEKVSDFVSNADPVIWEKERRDQLINDFNVIDRFLAENMEDSPLLRPLVNKIKSLVEEKPAEPEDVPEETVEEQLPAEPQEPGEQRENQDHKPAPMAKETAKPRKIVSQQSFSDTEIDPFSMVKQGLDFLGKSVSGLMRQDTFNPLPYRLNRISAWSLIDAPPTATGGKTMLPPPDDNVISSINALYDAGKWQDLADMCESRVRQYLFWLDLSRYVAESMEETGHHNISEIIGRETYMFVNMVPGIEKLSFSDGTPFADEDTKQWLKEIGGGEPGVRSDSASLQTDSIMSVISERMNNAQQMVKEKKIDSALDLFAKPMLCSFSQREQFLWKLGLCRLLIKSKQIKIAASYIDDILKNIEEYKLEIWEPGTAVEAFSLALSGLRLLKKDRNEELIESIINKIAMLDPVKAMEFI